MASEGLSRGGIFRQGKRGFVVCGQISNLVGASNKTIGNLYAVNSGVCVRQPRRNCRAPQHRLRVRRQQLDIVSAQCHQAVTFSCDFELDPARMDLLNLSDSIFRELVHNETWIADARIAIQGRTDPRVAGTLTSSVRKFGGSSAETFRPISLALSKTRSAFRFVARESRSALSGSFWVYRIQLSLPRVISCHTNNHSAHAVRQWPESRVAYPTKAPHASGRERENALATFPGFQTPAPIHQTDRSCCELNAIALFSFVLG